MNKDKKAVLSIQVDKDYIRKLKAICDIEKRSQAKTIEVLIDDKAERLKIK